MERRFCTKYIVTRLQVCMHLDCDECVSREKDHHQVDYENFCNWTLFMAT